jgi:hypothetical protein
MGGDISFISAGGQHLAAQPGTLFSLLEDLTPKRVLLGSFYR